MIFVHNYHTATQIIFLDALEAVLLHSESARWLLNRKKLTRQILFEYLHLHKVVVSGQAEKIVLVDHVLDFWVQTYYLYSIIYTSSVCFSYFLFVIVFLYEHFIQEKQITGRMLSDAQCDAIDRKLPSMVDLPRGSTESTPELGDMGIKFTQWWFGDILLSFSPSNHSTPKCGNLADQFFSDG